jgi:starvation-inducible DNA-binding protein
MDIATVVNPLVADTIALFVKTKAYAWRINGDTRNRSLLNDSGAYLLEIGDSLAICLGTKGATSIQSIDHVARLQSIPDDDGSTTAMSRMVEQLRADSESLVAHMLAVHWLCGESGDRTTADVVSDALIAMNRLTRLLTMYSEQPQ